MLNHTKKELQRLAHQILAQKYTWSTTEMIDQVQQIYKQLIILEHLENHPQGEHLQEEISPVMNTINELVTELPIEEENAAVEELFNEIVSPEFVKKETPSATSTLEKKEETLSRSLNDVLGKGIQIGLNDRLAFIKNLFDENQEDYQRVIAQLHTFPNWEEAQRFIEEMVKPDYNHWEGQEEFEVRFLKCIEANF